MSIERICVISTMHVSSHTSQLIDIANKECKDWAPAFSRLHGWMFSTRIDPSYDDAPTDLYACIQYARTMECDWLMLDSDGERTEDLRLFNW